MLRDRLAQTVEAGDAVPFGVHDPVAVLVAQHATLRKVGMGGGEAEIGDIGAGFGFQHTGREADCELVTLHSQHIAGVIVRHRQCGHLNSLLNYKRQV